MGPVLVDANLLLLLIVGSTDRRYISVHKNLSHYSEADFDILAQAISLFSDVILLPHVLAEVSNLARQIKNPARVRIQRKLRDLIEVTPEVMLPSLEGVRRSEFPEFGLTDAVMLQLCMMNGYDHGVWLLSADQGLAVQAEMLGYNVLNFLHLRD